MDDIDRKILAELQANCRIKNAQLAAQVGLSPSPCLRRLRKLERSGAIAGYTAIIAPEALGLGLAAFAQVTLEKGDGSIDRAFVEAIADISTVSGWYACAGDYDYLLKIVVPDLEDYARTLVSLRRLKGVSSIKSGVVINPQPAIFAFYRLSYSPFHPANFEASASRGAHGVPSKDLDAYDRNILLSLQANARMPILELSRAISLSPPATLHRLRRLERNKVIVGYTAIVEPAAVGLSLVALVAVTMEKGADHSGAFQQAMISRPEVAACFAVAGDVDYEIRVVVPDIQRYAQFLKNYLRRLPGVSSVHSSLCIAPPPHLFSHYRRIKDPLNS